MRKEPSETVVRAWARLLRAQRGGLSAVESALTRAGLPPLVWYDVLLELERAGDAGLRPFELERAMLLPQYGVSRLIDKIEAAGHAARRPCGDDGRGQIVAITSAGRGLRRRMWPVYAAAIGEVVGARLSPAEAATLGDLLGKLIGAPAT